MNFTDTPVPVTSGTSTTETLGFAAWQRSASELFVPLQVDPADRTDFAGRLSGITASDATAVHITARPHDVHRTQDHVRSGGNGYFKFSLQLAGSALLVQDGRDTPVSPGEITVYDTSRPYTLSCADQASMLVVMVPHERLGGAAAHVADMVATRLGQHGLADVVGPVLSGLAARMGDVAPAVGRRLVTHAVDLLETMCLDDIARQQGPALGPAAPGTGGHGPELRRVLRYIETHLGETGLNPQSIAEAHFMSVRSLYKLFDDSGTTVAAWIRTRRLERAHAALTDPARADLPVGHIATECGLPDPAHFSRLFRSVYHVSPTQIRRQALADTHG